MVKIQNEQGTKLNKLPQFSKIPVILKIINLLEVKIISVHNKVLKKIFWNNFRVALIQLIFRKFLVQGQNWIQLCLDFNKNNHLLHQYVPHLYKRQIYNNIKGYHFFKSHLITNQSTYNVNYKIYKNSDNQWL